jgi:hypothetical protein
MGRNAHYRVALAVANSLWTPFCFGQWTAIRLHPAGFDSSEVRGVTPTSQGGIASAPPSPSLWAGSSQSWTSLGPPLGGIWAMSGDHQAGNILVPNATHAAMWQGVGSSVIDLNPFPGANSIAYGIAGNDQVGLWWSSSPGHAALWHGSAGSMVDLHPDGMYESHANATDGYVQVGSVTTPQQITHAAMWSGTAASFQNLGAAIPGYSEIFGVAGGVQVGVANFGSGDRAILWHGSATGYQDLTPGNAGVASLAATTGPIQVGYANLFGSGITAGVWFGTASSFIPLQSYLPPGYAYSAATCVAELNGTCYVGGYAVNAVTGNREGFLWVGTVPAPGTGAVSIALIGAGRRKRSR